ncbi:MAG: Micrococcal nuclease (thermonuclease)-like protein [Thermoleophilia bacterium]|nr:Micrococcal nuclease (thermonuclease)-like protein [Thermoleophilia bacterium]
MRPNRLFPVLTVIALLAVLAIPTTSWAGSYWAGLRADRGEVQSGVNGFSWHSHGGSFNKYGSHCEALPGSYIAGAYCILRFNVPAGLTAGAASGGGIARGDFRTANDNFVLRSERPNGNPNNVVDSPGDGAFNHGWGALGSYVDVGLRTTAATSTNATTNWFHINTIDILLNDPSAPVIRNVSAAGGAWKGPGCTALNYAWGDDGSQLWSTSLTNLSTGAGVHGWNATPSMTVVQSGVPTASFDTCLPAQPTGTYTYRTSATDRSGNPASYDFNITFDTTLPTLGEPTFAGAPIGDGATITTSYRPNFSWTIGDAHSGVASIQARIDGTPVPANVHGGTATTDLVADLSMADHTISMTVTDAVGNTTTRTQRVRVADATKPVITVNLPSRNGGNTPMLDVSAVDDRSGIAPVSWAVFVNAQPVVVASAGDRLQAELGYLVDGTHTIEVRVADRAGNGTVLQMNYTAQGNSLVNELPGIHGLYVLEAPATFEAGTMARIRAAAVKHGRPLAGMRAEIHQGAATIAGKPIAQDGTVDIAVTVNAAGPLTLTVNGSGMPDQTIEFRFVPKPEAAAAAAKDDKATAPTAAAVPATPPVTVDRVLDGDTIQLRDGRIVSLLQIDAPETDECFGGRSTRSLRALLRPGTRVTLAIDPRLTRTDAQGQLLRYVIHGRRNINRVLVQQGAAAPYFVKAQRGMHARAMLGDAMSARKARRGMWKACPATKLTPARGANTGPT